MSQCYASKKFFFFGQVLEDDHGSPVNGIPHVDKTPENPLASHHMFYAVAKHFVILIQNNKRGLEYHFFPWIDAQYLSMFSSALSTPPTKWLYTLIMFGC